MRIDWYTKAVLTVIAVLLAMITVKQYVSPDAVVQAQGSFAGVQYVIGAGERFFDSRTGEIWVYDSAKVAYKLRLTKLGQPLVEEK